MPDVPITIRRADDNDAETLSGFAARVFPLGGRPGADSTDLAAYISTELTRERFRSILANPHSLLLLAESGSSLAGYGLLVHQSANPQIDAHAPEEVRKLYVDPRYHGRGVADALMRDMLIAVAPECDVIWLGVFSENSRAIAFYERWGFRRIGTQHFLVGDDRQKDFLMRRDPPRRETR